MAEQRTPAASALLRAAEALQATACDAEARADVVRVKAVATRWPTLRGLLGRCLEHVEREAEQQSYGHYYGGDPRDFRPDPECSTDEERAAHAADCAAWNAWESAGEQGEPPAPSVRYGHAPIVAENIGADTVVVNTACGHVTFAGYGLGVTTWVDDELVELRDALREVACLTPEEAAAFDAAFPSPAPASSPEAE